MRYRHLSDHARSYPELGLDGLEPDQEFETEQPVVSPLLQSLDAVVPSKAKE